MTTKDQCLSFKGKHDFSRTSNDRYGNLNLNQNHQCLSVVKNVHSKDFSNESKKAENYGSFFKYVNYNQKIKIFGPVREKNCSIAKFKDISHDTRRNKSSISWKTSENKLPSEYLNIHSGSDENELKEEKTSKNKSKNASTLFLHIAAYENSIEAASNSFEGIKDKSNIDKNLKNAKPIPLSSTISNPFEFPRQQTEDSTEPAIMQFSASQQLLKPNQSGSSSNAKNEKNEVRYRMLQQAASRMELNVIDSGISRRTLLTEWFIDENEDVVRQVFEQYLRKDLPCGLKQCSKCSLPEHSALDPDNAALSKIFPFKHCILMDVPTITRFVDMLEDERFDNAVIIQTHWEYLMSTNPHIARKLDKTLKAGQKHLAFLMNDMMEGTFVNPEEFEGKDDELEAKLHIAANYLLQHWEPLDVKPIILVSTAEHKALYSEKYPLVATVGEYVEAMENHEELSLRIQFLLKKEETGPSIYPEYLLLSDVDEGLAKGKYQKGQFRVSPENYLEATVSFGIDSAEQWFIQGRVHMNRACQGDAVVVELLPKDQWTLPEKILRMREADEEMEEEDAYMEVAGDEEEAKKAEQPAAKKAKKVVDEIEPFPTAKVVAVLRRSWRDYCGIILPPFSAEGNDGLFSAFDKSIPRVRIEDPMFQQLVGKIVVVGIDDWPVDSFYPKGHLIQVIGNEGDRDAEEKMVLLEYDIRYEPFNADVLACLPQMPWKPTPESFRRDLTHLNICSVDPVGCTDIDDALHCIERDDGTFEVGVHIADVTHFIKPGTPIDREASLRSTSVYLCGRRIDMIPDLLSSNLCSLRGGELRYAFSVLWHLDSEAEVISTEYTKSLIQSKAALTYEKAQEMIDDPKSNDVITKSLRGLLKLSLKLKEKRFRAGALSLASSEIRFEIDNDTGTPLAVQEKKHLPTMSMVEEFMLLANISVARKIYTDFPDFAVLRRHPIPPKEQYEPLVKAAEALGFHVDPSTGKSLADSLDKANDPKKPVVNRMLRMLATRCMTQAVYFISSTISPEKFLHFGLAAPYYTHFTSPIRRYADVMVHRLLAASIEADKLHNEMHNKIWLIKQADIMNYRHRKAQHASRASILLNTYLMIKHLKEEVLEAFIVSIRRNGLQVHIPKYGLESVIFFTHSFAKRKTEDFADYRELQIKPFQKVKVSVSMVEKNLRKRLDVKLIEPKIDCVSADTDINTVGY